MGERHVRADRVAVIGAGVSGVAAAVHLKRAGVDFTLFERSGRAGGVWVFDERASKDPAFPSISPSVGDTPTLTSNERGTGDTEAGRRDGPSEELEGTEVDDGHVDFAPPGPAYWGLRNNVSTDEMEMHCHAFREGVEQYVPHHVFAEYIQGAAVANGVSENIEFDTRVVKVVKDGRHWSVSTERWDGSNGRSVHPGTRAFDAVVVATGHYSAPNVPDVPGLSEWKTAFPDRVQHSKQYRRPDGFRGQNVLVVGAGASSTDIARELGPVANAIFQSARGGKHSVPSHLLPDNCARVGGVEAFVLEGDGLRPDGTIPGSVRLKSGHSLSDLHRVVLGTGYHASFPFMRQYHADGAGEADADGEVLVTGGQQTHNLHKDIWYIKDPSLAFVGVPFHTATFSLFEFQAMAVAAVFAGRVALPSEEGMRSLYNERLAAKGSGRDFHSLQDEGMEPEYVRDLIAMINAGGRPPGAPPAVGHSAKFLEAYKSRGARRKWMADRAREASVDEALQQKFSGWRVSGVEA